MSHAISPSAVPARANPLDELGRYFHGVWHCRYFWLSLVRKDLKARYHGSAIGLGWSLLNPLLMTAVLCVVFANVFKMPIAEYGPYLFAGLTFWGFVTDSTSGGCNCFQQASPYILQHPAPLAIYPLRTVLGGLFHLTTAMVGVFILTAILARVFHPVALLVVPPALLLLVVAGWAAATIFGVAHLSFRDTSHLTAVGMQVLFYATPIIYPPSMMENRGFANFLEANPMTHMLFLFRDPILYGTPAPARSVAIAVTFTVLLVGVAAPTLYFNRKRLVYSF